MCEVMHPDVHDMVESGGEVESWEKVDLARHSSQQKSNVRPNKNQTSNPEVVGAPLIDCPFYVFGFDELAG
jgi:hypothetical protein